MKIYRLSCVILLISTMAYGVDDLTPISKEIGYGKSNIVEYSAIMVLSKEIDSKSIDVIITIRNIGAKNIALNEENFGKVIVTDITGNAIDCAVISKPNNIAYGTATTFHIRIKDGLSHKTLKLVYNNENKGIRGPSDIAIGINLDLRVSSQ